MALAQRRNREMAEVIAKVRAEGSDGIRRELREYVDSELSGLRKDVTMLKGALTKLRNLLKALQG